MTWFQEFRGEYGFTYYGENRTAVTTDIPLTAVIYACVLISIATLIAAAGIRGKERWYTLLRVLYSLAVGSTIILSIYGFCWLKGQSTVTSPYIYRSDAKVNGEIGVIIGLQKVNITLTGKFASGGGEVAYNEAVALDGVSAPTWKLRECLMRGLPDPVIAIVEYLATDDGGLRWGRGFTMAGYIAHILLWTAFSFWLLANIMLCSVVFYGASFITLTGICMVLANISYHVLQPAREMRMLCSDNEFILQYGTCFWAVLVVGILTTLIGVVMVIMDYVHPKIIAAFFLIDTQSGDDSCDSVTFNETNYPSSSNLYQYNKNMRRHLSLPNIGFINKGFEFGEFNKPNPVYEEKEEVENTITESSTPTDENNECGEEENKPNITNNTDFHIGDVHIVIEDETQKDKKETNNSLQQDNTETQQKDKVLENKGKQYNMSTL